MQRAPSLAAYPTYIPSSVGEKRKPPAWGTVLGVVHLGPPTSIVALPAIWVMSCQKVNVGLKFVISRALMLRVFLELSLLGFQALVPASAPIELASKCLCFNRR
ncbi:hypothetical protein BDBG_17661 [Blastomyces gilchristii SLH14081]|uniref:Uncharacterized protein n=1 Tax=Blastomyces gilchristii (strain SLH14081) TaxID=559298 RepID=A0A179UZ23_BLAGS|nr:uncharacterized protein BDBG_17661 [Blastomyces gilchristii SLH14081]OAT12357.1 hypothetical protein BDBG_17661 [Blastomyces gilchristii SLH14081]